MTAPAALLAACLTAYASFAAIAWSMERHKRQMAPARPPQREGQAWSDDASKMLGWAGLAGALLLCVSGLGWSMGAAAWFGIMSVAGVLLVLTLAYWPALTRHSASAALLAAAGLFIGGLYGTG